MTRRKNNKSALILSGLSLLLCVSLLVGATFAWFTDTATTSVNQIQSGTLKVDLVDAQGKTLVGGDPLEFVKAAGTDKVLWEPGATYNLPAVHVKNDGDLKLKYKLQITGLKGDAKLNDAIVWTITLGGKTVDINTEFPLEAGATSEALTISGHMKEDAGNEYQDLTIDGVAITVYAAQLGGELGEGDNKVEGEYDSNDNIYDKTAEYPIMQTPETDGTLTPDTPEENPDDSENPDENPENPEPPAPTSYTFRNSDGTVVVTVPADAVKDTDGASVTISPADPTNEAANTAIEAAGKNAVAYEISFKGVELGGVHLATATFQVSENLENVVLYHEGVQMTAAGSAAEVDAANEFHYNIDTGIIKICINDCSLFTVGFDPAEAVIESVAYGTLARALNSAKAGETVTLAKDIQVGTVASISHNSAWMVIPAGVTLDGNGKTIDASAANFENTFNYTESTYKAHVLGTANGATVQNLKVIGGGTNVGHLINNVDVTGVTLKNITLGNTTYYGIVANNSTVSMTNITAAEGAAFGWGHINADKGAAVTIDTLNGVSIIEEGISTTSVTVTDDKYGVEKLAEDKILYIYTENAEASVDGLKYITLDGALNAATGTETVALLTDIDMTNRAWTPVDDFAGTFDGQNHTISNLNTNLFKTVSGTVENVNVTNVNIVNATKNGANGFIGTVADGGLVDGCKVSGVDIKWTAEVNAKDTTDGFGGVIGGVQAGATVQDCEFTNISVTSNGKTKRTGAVFSGISGTVKDCIVDGVNFVVVDDDGNKAYITEYGGGFAASVNGGAVVEDCTIKNMTVTADYAQNGGGIFGKAFIAGQKGDITLKNITVDGLNATIGTMKFTNGAYKNFGGFIGQVDSRSNTVTLKVDNCHINGLDMTLATVSTGESPAAGFISCINGNATITNCSVDGKIDGTNDPLGIGGFLGDIGGHGCPADGYTVSISGSNADVAITGNDNIFVGGFVGYAGSYRKNAITFNLTFTDCAAKDSFYGKLETTDTTETITFTNCKVDGAAFTG